MNELIAKRGAILSLVFGGIIGLISLIPTTIGLMLFVLSFVSSIFIIFIMKKDKKQLSFIDNREGAILGAIIGFFSSIGFFATFCPMVLILHLIFKSYYSYGIPYIIHDALWLFFVILFFVCLIIATTNAAIGMGFAFLLSKFEVKPRDFDYKLDIEINDYTGE